MQCLLLDEIIKRYSSDERTQRLESYLLEPKARIKIKGLVGSSSSVLPIALSENSKHSQVFILPTYEEAAYYHTDLENLRQKPVLFFPASFKKSFEITQTDSNQLLQRAEVLSELNERNTERWIVTYSEAIAEMVIDKETLQKNTLEIQINTKLSIDFIQEFLTEFGFERTDFVYQAGQFSIRGGIVDIFSFSHDEPYRIEFFGDTIESIRTFDIVDQLSTKNIHHIHIVPNVQTGLMGNEKVSFFDFLHIDSILWMNDLQFSLDVIEKGIKKAKKHWDEIPNADKQLNPDWQSPEQLFDEKDKIKSRVLDFSVIEFGKQFMLPSSKELDYEIKPQPSFNKDFTLLQKNLSDNTSAKFQNYLFAEMPKQLERLYSIFEDLGKKENTPVVEFTPIPIGIREGFIDPKLKIACYTDHQIFDRFYKYKYRKNYSASQAITLKELRDLKPGDFVTHIDHGIGKYAGLEKIEVNGKLQEAIRLVYAGNDLLYVNINSLNRISKYSGKDGTEPKMNKLGTDTWNKLKSSTKKKVKDIARDLIKLYAKRKAKEGFAYTPDTYLQTELEASFIYEDTPDQVKATVDFKKDMEAPHPMDRLVCGDVGFGKTEIAVRAAFKAVTDSKQVAVLVPTTILALQHYKTFKERLKDFPCNIEYVSRFRTSKQIKETVQRLAEGKVDIIIGTHRLVSKDVKFKNLGLLIIDEEQKFGVSTKEKLKSLRVNIDTLTLTATPIPRTLHFSLMGARDLSIISTPPPNRQPVTTELHVFNEKLIKEAIEYEVDRGGQVFFVHNRVKDIFEVAGLVKKLCPDVRVCIGHGQMEGDALEDVMQDFIEHKYDVLVATTIIESGLDISNANTIFINQAQNFGLSDLHQMRGRVGRSNTKSFCYLLSPPLSTLTPEARKRLSAIEEFSDLGSGFNIAMRDLDIRGAGNLLGAEQSGFIAEIGFEMYHKILDEAIQELKEEEFSDIFADDKENTRPFVHFTQVDTDLEMLIPDEYVSNITERYNLYTELSKVENEEELQLFAQKLIDRFGPLPKQVMILLSVMRMQWKGKAVGFEKISFKNRVLRGSFVANQQSKYFETPQFMHILRYVQQHPRSAKMKEGKNALTVSFSDIYSVDDAVKVLDELKLNNTTEK